MNARNTSLKFVRLAWKRTPQPMKDKIYNLALQFYHEQKIRRDAAFEQAKSSPSKLSKALKKKDWKIKGHPKVSIIIATRDQPHHLNSCINAIEQNTKYQNYEVILVNNNTHDPEAVRILKNTKHKVVNYSYKFNFSKANNFGAKFARGEYLVFLNNDTMPEKGWLEAMLSVCQDKKVGVVGNKLLYGDRTIQHAGIVNDYYLQPDHAFRHFPENYPDANKMREVLAVTGACLMIKKSVFQKIGGFDPEYWVEKQDVDLCFKVKKLGLKVIYCPYSVVIHHELTTRGPVRMADSIHDFQVLKKKWFKNYYLKSEINDNQSSKKQTRILIIKLMSLGDTILCLPIAEALKKKYPGCHLTFAIGEKYSELVKDNPFVDAIYVCKDFDKSKIRNIDYYEVLTKELLELNRWDKIYQLNCLNMGFDFSKTEHHLIELYADMANVDIAGLKPALLISDYDFKIVSSFLRKNCKKNRKTILIHTRAGWDLKNWEPKKFQALANRLKEKYNVIQVGSKNDFMLKNVPRFLGDPLKPLIAIIKRADLLIGPDSGPMHIASALGTPLIALFGSTSPPRSGPLWNNFICIQSDSCCNDPCHAYDCLKKKGYNCTEEIDIRDALKAVNKMMSRKGTIQETWWCGFVYPGRAENVFNVSPLKRALEK